MYGDGLGQKMFGEWQLGLVRVVVLWLAGVIVLWWKVVVMLVIMLQLERSNRPDLYTTSRDRNQKS